MSNGLSEPGTSVYSSGSMYVGDGTWDSQRNTFLLPNLQGLNFETMRLNGMGNRFRSMASYKGLITAHGVLAVITFLFVIPAAIFMARFYHPNPRAALKFHIWLQVSAVLLSTAAIVCAFQAVGLERSLTNPHHGIGVALYTLVLVQAFGGSVIHRLEKGKERFKIPLTLMIHQWLGRAIALLGVAQIPLGLTLYGSPLVLFILFAVWTFILVILYFILAYRGQPRIDLDDRSTYISERSYSTRLSRRSRGPGAGKYAAAGAAGAGLAALGSRSRSRTRSRHGGTVLSSRPDSRSRRGSRSRVTDSEFTESYLSDEKYGDDRKKGPSWKDRLLGAGAAVGGIFAAKKLFSRKEKRPPTETGSDFSYSRPLGPSEVTQTDISRLEEGRAPESPAHRRDDWRRVEERDTQVSGMTGSNLRSNHRPTRSVTSIDSFDSRTSFSDETDMRPKDRSYGVKEGVAALGVFGFLKHSLSKRSKKKEDQHVEEMREQDLEEERIARMNSQRRKYTGDGTPPRRGGRPPSTILSDSELTGITPSVTRPPMDSTLTPSVNPNRTPRTGVYSVLSDSGSEAYDSPGGRRHQRRRTTDGPVLPPGAAAAGTITSPSRKDHHRRRGSRDDVASPPVSVKVKMHNDGRHVTLRRLNEEEAAAEREARKRDRRGKNRAGSVSSLSGIGGDRWRRTEAMEAAQAQEMAQQAGIPPPPPMPNSGPLRMPEATIPPSGTPVYGQDGNIPPPPPIPGAADTVLSSPPGTQIHGTETDLSNYDTNRRRRRAERAQAKQARLGGSRVEFS